MTSVRRCPLPTGALLERYARDGAYTDSYVVELPRAVGQAAFIEAFYTSPVFKIERSLLAWFLSKPSTDAQAHQLAVGDASTFAAWLVEQRDADQLLLAAGSTRSWLMAAPSEPGRVATKLYFGSAVVPRRSTGANEPRMGWQFRLLLGFHKGYSRVLLAAAARLLDAV